MLAYDGAFLRVCGPVDTVDDVLKDSCTLFTYIYADLIEPKCPVCFKLLDARFLRAIKVLCGVPSEAK